MGKINSVINSPEYKSIEADVESFVCEKLKDYIPADTGKKQFMILFGVLLITLNGKCNLLTRHYFKD